MTRQRIVVQSAVHAFVQDLGRPGFAAIGVSPNGAADQHAARTANILVGNVETAPVIEVSGSAFAIRCEADTLVAATGAATDLLVDGHPQPTWELVPVWAGCTVALPAPGQAGRLPGLRSYLAVNGTLDVPSALGSVAPDVQLDVGRALTFGDAVALDSDYVAPPGLPLFRLGARPPTPPADGVARINVTPGPDLDRLAHGAADVDATFRVLPDSNHVGLRLGGPPVTLQTSEEILSRGVPVGAVQITHSGGVIVLLRGRMVTAGYPIVAVATTASLDALGQLRAGDHLRFQWCTAEDAVSTLRARDGERRALAARVRAALTSRGLADVLGEAQAGRIST